MTIAEHAELMEQALSRPQEAAARARAILASRPDPGLAAVARQALAFVLREFGDVDAAVVELRAAVRLARTARSPERETEVLATLGVTLVSAGRTMAGLRALDAAVARASGPQRGRIGFLRGGVLLILGRHDDAMRDLNRAVLVLTNAAQPVWLARALTERAFTRIAVGAVHRAAGDLQRAAALFAEHGQELEVADAAVHRGVLAQRVGDLPAALLAFDQAAELFTALELTEPALSEHRCAALLAAGLPGDALAEASTAVARMEQIGGKRTKLADLLLTTATCALAAGDAPRAGDYARRASAVFTGQRRRWWMAHAKLIELQARAAVDAATVPLLRAVERCVRTLDALGSPEAPTARLLAGRLAMALALVGVADRHLAAVAGTRRRGPALARTVGWVAEALRAEVAGDTRRVRHACRAGLAVLDEHRDTLGSPELHARATAHGAELARIGLRHTLMTGRARLLLACSERARASTLAVPPVLPPDDVTLLGELSALRETQSRLAAARAKGLPTQTLQREQARHEKAVRTRTLRTGRADVVGRTPLDVAALLEHVGPDRLLEILDIDGQLHVIVVGDGRVRRFAAGTTAAAATAVENARFLLNRLAHATSTTVPRSATTRLDAIGRSCTDLLLGPAAEHLGDGAVTIVPPGRLHATPWSLLPALRDRPVTVTPSAALWLRTRTTPVRADGDVVLVRGPGLAESNELAQLGGLYPAPVVLDGAAATTAAVLDTLDGARLAHIAAHGTFRADSPLFSALRVADGALTGYDLQRLRAAPQRVVLSSCESGLVAAAGADELLGLACALIPLGTTAITASVVRVNDAAVAPLMIDLHHHLRTGVDMATALCRARAAGPARDPVTLATGWSFITIGAG